MSVTDEGNVLVACCGINKIKEYTTHGSLVREIQLPHDAKYTTNVVQLPNDQFGVTHGDASRSSALLGYYVADSDGRVLRSYASPSVPANLTLKNPSGLTLDGDGNAFICDYSKDKVVMLNQMAFCATEQLVEGGLQRPYTVHYDKERDRLYIGERSGACRLLVLAK